MADKETRTVITKDELRKEIRKENKKYRRKRGIATFAVMLVLIALVLIILFADKKGLFGGGDGEGFSIGKFANKVSDAINEYADEAQVEDEGKYLEANLENEEIVEDEGKEEYLKNNTIVVSDVDIIFEGEKMASIDELEDKILEKEYTSEDVITLKEDKAIMSVYLEVKDLLDELDDIQYIEE